MIKRLLKSVREFKKDALLTPFFEMCIRDSLQYRYLVLRHHAEVFRCGMGRLRA